MFRTLQRRKGKKEAQRASGIVQLRSPVVSGLRPEPKAQLPY